MELKRTEIMPSVWLSVVASDRIDSTCISINMLTQLEREDAAIHALIPYVLCRGTALLPSPEAIQSRLSQLGLTSLSPIVRKFGEIHSIGIRLASEHKPVDLPAVIDLICSALVAPATKGGLLNQSFVEQVKNELVDFEEYEDNIFSYARFSCVSEMCCYEDYSTPLLGESSDIASVHYLKLTKEYRNLLQTCPIEIICCVPSADSRIARCFRDSLTVLPRAEINEELGTDIRLNAIEEDVRIINTRSADGPAAFSVGYRFGDCMDDADFVSMGIMCQLLESLLSEEENFDQISVEPDIHKGIFTVTGKSDTDDISSRIEQALQSITALKDSDPSLVHAIQTFSSRSAELGSESSSLEEFFLSQTLCGLDYSPEELSQAALGTSAADIAHIASTCECDLIFLADPA